jgi:hypothetical protein
MNLDKFKERLFRRQNPEQAIAFAEATLSTLPREEIKAATEITNSQVVKLVNQGNRNCCKAKED